MKIAFLGIGLMGWPMARRLCEAGFEVHAWNRTRVKAEQLRPHGGHVHDTPAQAVHGASIVVSMLENGPITEQVLFAQGAAAAMQHGALLADMASIAPREARDHAARLSDLGVDHLDAPVSGGTGGAE
ncbi:NAD(P)-binding domain-containing protein, partial [Ramlibacter sp.]|uniref:NAD(P)-dependent oxidoreductase n=1 Tax=Ramlibacter sp. TaxID=1917967 RepID=UPI0017A43E50